MHFKKKGLEFFVFFVSLTVLLSGCDQVESLMDKFSKKESKPAVKPQATQAPSTKQAKPMAQNVLARVGSWTITKEEFQDRLSALKEVVPEYNTDDPEARKLVLDELVRQQLLVEDAEQSGLAKNKDIVAAVEEFRRTLIVRETAAKITENLEVTDEEVRTFYEEKKDLLIEEAEWKVRQIVVDSEVEAKAALDQIDKGTKFASAAKMYSKADNADKGGDLGYITDVSFPEMAGVLLALKEGETSDIFQGPDGFYIIKLEEKRGGKQIPLEDIKEDIRQNRILFKQQQKILDYIAELQKRIPVEINESNL